MTDKNFDEVELESKIREAYSFVDQLSKQLTSSIDVANNYQKSQKQKNEFEKDRLTFSKSARLALEESIAGMLNIGMAMSGSGSSFAPLKTTVDLVANTFTRLTSTFGVFGKVVDGMAHAVADAAKFAIDTFENTFKSYQQLSDTGLVRNFTDLSQISGWTRMSFDSLSNILPKYSADLARMGGSAIAGTEQFKRMSSITLENRSYFLQLGVSYDEYGISQLEFIKQMSKTQMFEKTTYDKMAFQHKEYLDSIIILGQLTGKTRQTLEQERNARLEDARFLAFAQGMKSDDLNAINELLDALNSQGIDGKSVIAKGIQQMMSAVKYGNAMPNTEEAKAVMFAASQSGSGISFPNLIKDFVNNPTGKVGQTIDQLNQIFGTQYIKATHNLTEATGEIGTIIDKINIEAKNYEMNASRAYDERIGAAKAERDALSDEQKRKNKELAESKDAANNLALSVQRLVTESNIMTQVMNYMSEKIDGAVTELYDFAGTAVPTYIKLSQEYKSAYIRQASLQTQLDDVASKIKESSKIVEADAISKVDPETKQHHKNDVVYQKAQYKRLELLLAEQKLLTEQRRIEVNESKKAAGVLEISPDQKPTVFGSNPANNTGGTIYRPTITDKSGLDAIKEMIGAAESFGGNYNIQVHESRSSKELTKMTLLEVMKLGHAAGKYQIIPSTLKRVADALGLNLSTTLYDENTQEKMGEYLIGTAKYDAFKSGKIDANQFIHNLASIWYGIPTPFNNWRSVGEGDRWGNHSTISRENTEKWVNQAKTTQPGARTGGIFRGPSTGYMTILHGDEIVIPANDGQNTQLVTDLFSESDEKIIDFYNMITTKVTNMITLMDDSALIQRKIIKLATI